MVFRSKVDSFFIKFIFIVILIISAVILIPSFLDDEFTTTLKLINLAICLAIVGFILWSCFSIQYIFNQDHLFVKGGPFRSRIPYEQITKVAPTNSIFIGYRILSAKEGLEIFYRSAMLGSVKISPKEEKLFITELKKRCPNIDIQL